jgi:quinol-cytochrome oxidoreductase complex cytochrome b subunit
MKITGVYYKSPANFSYAWNFGFMALYFLISQIVTGIFLAMFYSADVDVVFGVVVDLNNEIYYGWWLRHLHANGASFFFMVVYLHMARGMYYGSFVFPRQALWISGGLIWVLMIATAFLGYVLPWGQMSFWGAMVITSLIGAIPGIGGDLLFLLWGGFSIDDITLHRFYSLHFTLPFVILMLAILHFALLHEFGSNNGLGVHVKNDFIPFVPYYGIKDVLSLFLVLVLFFVFVIWCPDKLGHSDNFILANALVTPAHIVPEWYFLPLYAILRSVTNKLLGIFLIACAILCIFLVPYVCKGYSVRNTMYRPLYCVFVWLLYFDCWFLAWVGGVPIMYPYNMMGLWATILYFLLFLVFFPGLLIADKWHYSANAYFSQKDNDSSSTSGVRVCNSDLSEFVVIPHPRRRFILYKPLNCHKFIYV